MVIDTSIWIILIAAPHKSEVMQEYIDTRAIGESITDEVMVVYKKLSGAERNFISVVTGVLHDAKQ